MRKITITIAVAVMCMPGVYAQPQLEWQLVQPGIWKATVGREAAISYINLMQNVPQTAALSKLPASKFPLEKEDITVNISNGQVSLRFPLDEEETIFGLGLNFKTVNQRGRILNLHVDHYGGVDNGRTHAPVPFYVSSKGYGVLIDAAQYINVYAGTGVRKDAKHPPELKDRNTDKTWEAEPYSDAMEINIPGETVVIYIFGGPTPMNVVQRYNLFNGGGSCLRNGALVLRREYRHCLRKTI